MIRRPIDRRARRILLAPGCPVRPPDNNRNPPYAVGNMAYVNISAIYVLGRSKISGFSLGEAALMGEIGYNHLMTITKNPQTFDHANRSHDAYAIAGYFGPSYFQVFPHTDVTRGRFGYTPRGKSASDSTFGGGCDRCGNISPSIQFTYMNVWIAKVAFNHYWGRDTGIFSPGPNAGLQLSRGRRLYGIKLATNILVGRYVNEQHN